MKMFVAFNDYMLEKNWWGFNKLSLCCPLDTYLTLLLPNLNHFATLSCPTFSAFAMLDCCRQPPWRVVFAMQAWGFSSWCFLVQSPKSKKLFIKWKMLSLRWMWRPRGLLTLTLASIQLINDIRVIATLTTLGSVVIDLIDLSASTCWYSHTLKVF